MCAWRTPALLLPLVVVLFPACETVPPAARHRPEPVRSSGRAVAFGEKSQWLAVKTSKPEVVAELLGLRNLVSADWKRGVEAAYGGDKVFVTPAVDGWVLALDTSYVAFDDGDLVERPETIGTWSKALGVEVQHFFCDRGSQTFGWMRAENGRLVRAVFEVEGEVRTNIGAASESEVESRAAVQGEELVFRLAARWSVDPHLLDQRGDLGPQGLLGDPPP